MEHFREALSYDGESFLATVSLASSLIELGRYEEALHYSTYAQMKQPDHAEANAQLGINYFHLKRDEEALEYLLRAKRIDPGHYTYPQIYLAKIYGRTGRPAEAIGELEDLIERRPELPAAKQVAETLEKLQKAVAEPEGEAAPCGKFVRRVGVGRAFGGRSRRRTLGAGLTA